MLLTDLLQQLDPRPDIRGPKRYWVSLGGPTEVCVRDGRYVQALRHEEGVTAAMNDELTLEEEMSAIAALAAHRGTEDATDEEIEILVRELHRWKVSAMLLGMLHRGWLHLDVEDGEVRIHASPAWDPDDEEPLLVYNDPL